MFVINKLVAQSSTVNWQDVYYTKNLETIALTNYTNFIIIIIIIESAVQGRERLRALYQSKDPNPTQPTHGRKKNIKQ